MKSQLMRITCCLAFLAGGSAAAQGTLVEYDCHVVLETNAPHIVFTEAPDRPRAEALAARVRVKVAQKRTVGVKQVKQCAQRHKERLWDPVMESRRASKPL